MRKITLFKILRLLTLGLAVLAIFVVKKNNNANQKSSSEQGLISQANADTLPEGGCGGGGGGSYSCLGEGGAEGEGGGCDGCY